jgi:hypothetical protein
MKIQEPTLKALRVMVGRENEIIEENEKSFSSLFVVSS